MRVSKDKGVLTTASSNPETCAIPRNSTEPERASRLTDNPFRSRRLLDGAR